MDDLSALWIILGIGVLILGPAGGVFMGIKGSVGRIEATLKQFMESVSKDREDTRMWLKSLQGKTDTNETDIAILMDRQDRSA